MQWKLPGSGPSVTRVDIKIRCSTFGEAIALFHATKIATYVSAALQVVDSATLAELYLIYYASARKTINAGAVSFWLSTALFSICAFSACPLLPLKIAAGIVRTIKTAMMLLWPLPPRLL